jgi:hypothetical protein
MKERTRRYAEASIRLFLCFFYDHMSFASHSHKDQLSPKGTLRMGPDTKKDAYTRGKGL